MKVSDKYGGSHWSGPPHLTLVNILEPIYLDDFDTEADYTNQAVTFRDPERDLVFNHNFISLEIEKYGLMFEGCGNCSQIVKHFVDDRSLSDVLVERQILWIKFKEAVMACLFPHLKIPVTDPSNINLELLLTRP